MQTPPQNAPATHQRTIVTEKPYTEPLLPQHPYHFLINPPRHPHAVSRAEDGLDAVEGAVAAFLGELGASVGLGGDGCSNGGKGLVGFPGGGASEWVVSLRGSESCDEEEGMRCQKGERQAELRKIGVGTVLSLQARGPWVLKNSCG